MTRTIILCLLLASFLTNGQILVGGSFKELKAGYAGYPQMEKKSSDGEKILIVTKNDMTLTCMFNVHDTCWTIFQHFISKQQLNETIMNYNSNAIRVKEFNKEWILPGLHGRTTKATVEYNPTYFKDVIIQYSRWMRQ